VATKEQPTIADMLGKLGDTLVTTAYLPNLSRYEPHKKQQKFHMSQKKGRLYIGGNRAGKTIADVLECIMWITKTHPHRKMPNEPVRGRLVCVDFINGLGKIILPLFKQWLPKKYLIDGQWEKSWNKESKTLTLENGSFIEFMSYDQDLDKFAGTSRHFVAFDEEPPKHIFNECRARLIDTGGSWWISMTPLDGLTWVYEDIYEPVVESKTNAKFDVIQADMLDNPHISREEAEEYLSGLDPQERSAREKGQFVQLGGRVFKNFNPEVHRWNEETQGVFTLTPDMRVYTSIDIGWAHPTAWLWHAVEPNGRITTFHEMVESFVDIQSWAQKIKEFESENNIKVYLRTGDPALRQTRSNTGVSDIQEYARHGIFLAVEGVPTGPGSVNIGLVKIEQYMKPDTRYSEDDRPYWQYTANCTTLEHQMLRLRWATYASKKMQFENAPKGTIHKKDDDAPDSLRYFFTLQPDLAFSTATGSKVNMPDRVGAVKQVGTPVYDNVVQSMFREPVSPAQSLFKVNDVSEWDMEGVG